MNLRSLLPPPASPFDDVGPEQIARYVLVAFLVVMTTIQLPYVWWLRVIGFLMIGVLMADYGPKVKNRRAARIGVAVFALLAIFVAGSQYYSYIMQERVAKIMRAAEPVPPLLALEQKEIMCGNDWPVCSQRDYAAALEHYTTWVAINRITFGVGSTQNDTVTPWLTEKLGSEKAQAAIARGRAAAGARP